MCFYPREWVVARVERHCGVRYAAKYVSVVQGRLSSCYKYLFILITLACLTEEGTVRLYTALHLMYSYEQIFPALRTTIDMSLMHQKIPRRCVVSHISSVTAWPTFETRLASIMTVCLRELQWIYRDKLNHFWAVSAQMIRMSCLSLFILSPLILYPHSV